MANMKKNIKDPVQYIGLNYEELAKHYEPVMIYTENKVNQNNKTNTGFDLYATTCRLPMSLFRLGGLDQNPWVLDWNNRNNPYYNSVCMNTDTGKKKGLKTGDRVAVESPYGKTEGKLYLTETMHPQCIVIPGALGRMDKSLGEQTAGQVCFNKLLTGKLGHISPIHGGIETTARVKVYKV